MLPYTPRTWNDADVGPPVSFTRMFPSVNEVVVSPDWTPVALTLYCATNQSGSWNSSRIAPLSSAVTSTFLSQVLPASSLTEMLTDSPGCQLDPVRVTVAPGG